MDTTTPIGQDHGMSLVQPGTDEALALAERVDPQYRPAWVGRPLQEQAALAMYFLRTRPVNPPS